MKKFGLLRSRGVALVVASAAAVSSSFASAALPAWAATAGADLSGSVSDYENMVGGIVLAVVVAVVGIKLFKRFANKI